MRKVVTEWEESECRRRSRRELLRYLSELVVVDVIAYFIKVCYRVALPFPFVKLQPTSTPPLRVVVSMEYKFSLCAHLEV